jgi:TfoX/Sxy family transcriptional regulator of competence genes
VAYDARLAERVRDALPLGLTTERKMFGGIAWMVQGNMCCGILGDDLIVRLGPERGETALAEPHVRPFDFTGTPMRSTVFVAAEGVADNEALLRWVDEGLDFALSLPPK